MLVLCFTFEVIRVQLKVLVSKKQTIRIFQALAAQSRNLPLDINTPRQSNERYSQIESVFRCRHSVWWKQQRPPDALFNVQPPWNQ